MAHQPGLKQYVKSNFVKMGNGPTAWFASTTCVKQEMYGGWTQSLHVDPVPQEDIPEEEADNEDGLQALIDNSEGKIGIKLTTDLALTAPIEVGEGKEIILDLGGNTLTANNGTGIEVKGGKVTIDNGSITGSKRALTVANGGEAIVNGGTYTTTFEGQVMSTQGEGSTLTINGGNFTSQECGAMAFNGATLIVNDGNFDTIDNFAIGTNGSEGRGKNTIVVNKATISANITSANYEACGIYVANDDEVTIGKDVVINVLNGCGILMRAGNVTVKKGVKINLTTDKGTNFTGYVGDNKTKMTQSGIIYHESANYPGKAGMSLVVEDGVNITGIAHSI